MAIYHLSVKPVQRSKGRSSTAAAAYRAGCMIEDERTGLTHDYTKKGGIEHTEVITPDGVNAPDRQTLWNMAEKAERRKDGCTAREYEVNLPYELTREQRISLAQDFSRQLAEQNGNAVDLCLHEPDQRNPKNNTTGSDPRNYHAHILTTTRKITNDGLTDKCDIEKSGRKRKEDLANIRKLWETTCNRHLEMAGIDARIDHRSHADRGIDTKPTIKMGWKATQAERAGIETYKGDINRAIRSDNARIAELKKDIYLDQGRLLARGKKDEIKEQREKELHREIEEQRRARERREREVEEKNTNRHRPRVLSFEEKRALWKREQAEKNNPEPVAQTKQPESKPEPEVKPSSPTPRRGFSP